MWWKKAETDDKGKQFIIKCVLSQWHNSMQLIFFMYGMPIGNQKFKSSIKNFNGEAGNQEAPNMQMTSILWNSPSGAFL